MDMNEHDELTERIQVLVSADAVWSSPEIYVPVGEVEIIDIAIPVTTAQKIIALVEQDVARRLLSDDAVDAAAKSNAEQDGDDWEYLVKKYPTITDAHRNIAKKGQQAALAAIGFTVEDDQP